MPKNTQYDKVAVQPNKGLHTDTPPANQPKNSYRFALNAVNESKQGEHGKISNELSDTAVAQLPQGFYPIGDRYIEDDMSVIISVNPVTGRQNIATLNKNDVYEVIVDTAVLGLKIEFQCDIIYRLRRGSEKVIYWVDAYNKARTFNLSRVYNFYTAAFQSYLRAGGNPNTYTLEKWDAASFDLIKSYKSIPFFTDVKIIEEGNILPGSYNFAVQYVDEDLNPTEWITTSNTVNIYNDNTNSAYLNIRGSKNSNTQLQNFPRASKSIKLTITNLDTSFPYYRVAIIQATGTTGVTTKALASELFSTSDSNFIYTGNDGNLSEVSLQDILIENDVIFAPHHIEQLENRLLLAYTNGKGINWCNFQKYASKIGADLTTKQVLLNNIVSEPNVKNAKSTFIYRGYMPGEVYSFGICYIFADGTVSPAFHIPGKSTANTVSSMQVYEADNKYLDVHNCSTNNYWSRDENNITLLGKKVRHHRLPFRKTVNKPLYTRTSGATVINQYSLTLNITLNPAWIDPDGVTPNYFPKDTGGLALVLTAGFTYQQTGSVSNDTFATTVTDSDLGEDISVYQNLTALNVVNAPDHYTLNSATDLFSYQDPTGTNYYSVPRFLISETYSFGPVSSSINTDISDIFGIEFSNIQKPHPDVTGFYIVRNEREDDDRLVLDNAVFGPAIQFNQYISFGLITPKQKTVHTSPFPWQNGGLPLNYQSNTAWFFNPEFQYFGKKTDFTRVELEGKYAETAVNYSTQRIDNGSGGDAYGAYVDDVQAGTSYDPAVNKKKDKDDDGFDLIIGYKNTEMSYSILNNVVFPIKSKVIYLNAASYENVSPSVYYNVSVDNKIGFFASGNSFDTSYFYNTTNGKNGLLYGSLMRDQTTAYSNFITRPYYKEHNNPIMFGTSNIINGVKIYNGDSQISSFNFVSSVFYDIVAASRKKKRGLIKIIVGAILVVASIAATIITAGAAAPLAAAVLSYGASLITSGIKFEQFQSMLDVDYELGLKETISDGVVYNTIRDTLATGDDTIRWFSDRVSNLYIESAVPFGLRAGMTCGVTDFMNAPSSYNEEVFKSYLIEKLTTVDRNQGSGRLYKGYASAEFYDVNKDYMRFNKEKLFIHLPIGYDCCSDSNEIYPVRIAYSEQSFQEERVDNYAVFLPNNYKDIEGEHGEITDLYRLGNSLYIQTKEALWQLPQNLQERVTGEIISFIGTGSFFSVPPRKIIDDNLGSGGTQHKWATVKTKHGVISISEVEGKIYLHSDKIKDLSIIGERNWFENNLKPNLAKQIFDKFGINYPHQNNPANPNGTGYLSVYDTRFERIIITKKDYKLLSNKLATLIAVSTKPVSGNAFVYAKDDGYFYQGTIRINLDNSLYFENKSWTKSFSFHTEAWISYHSYLPLYYFYNQNNFFSFNAGSRNILKYNIDGSYQTFNGVYYPHILEYVEGDGFNTKILEDLSLDTKAVKYDPLTNESVDMRFITFNKITVYNSRQCSGELLMIIKDTQVNPQNWYQQQIINAPGQILLTRKERDWNINQFRDNVIDYDQPLFSSVWADIASTYYIDKVVNTAVIDFNKQWTEMESFRDKFIVIRLKFDNFDNVNLITNYSVGTEQDSNR